MTTDWINKRNSFRSSGGGCLAISLVLGIQFIIWFSFYILSAHMFQYNLWNIIGKDIPWYGDALGGLFPLNIPIAIIVFIAHLCGVPTPWFHV